MLLPNSKRSWPNPLSDRVISDMRCRILDFAAEQGDRHLGLAMAKRRAKTSLWADFQSFWMVEAA